MAPGAFRGYQFIAHWARKREVGKSRVQMAKFAVANAKFDASEPVIVHRDARPRRNLIGDGLLSL